MRRIVPFEGALTLRESVMHRGDASSSPGTSGWRAYATEAAPRHADGQPQTTVLAGPKPAVDATRPNGSQAAGATAERSRAQEVSCERGTQEKGRASELELLNI